jgi:hypothetical protein
MTQPSETPVFVVGHPRSGTTLLRFMLSSHSQLDIPEETGFIPFLVPDNQLNADLSMAQVEEILRRIAQLNHLWRDMVPDVAAFYGELPEPRLCHVLDALYRQQIAPHGAVRWGDKTPVYVRYIATLDTLFPTAQFIHVIRDGRDAALSAQAKWPGRRIYMDNYYLLQHWMTNVESGRRAGQLLGGERYLEIRYEGLVQNPQGTLEGICAFLGETFEPAMLEPAQLARRVGPGPQHHVEVMQPVSSTSVARWKAEMNPFEQRMADHVAGRSLQALGYELSLQGPLSPPEHLRLGLLAAKFWVTSSTRSLLYRTGALTLNRGMRRPQES